MKASITRTIQTIFSVSLLGALFAAATWVTSLDSKASQAAKDIDKLEGRMSTVETQITSQNVDVIDRLGRIEGALGISPKPKSRR